MPNGQNWLSCNSLDYPQMEGIKSTDLLYITIN